MSHGVRLVVLCLMPAEESLFHSSSSWLSWKLGGGVQQLKVVAVLGRTHPPHGLAWQWRADVGHRSGSATTHTIIHHLTSVAPFGNIDAA